MWRSPHGSLQGPVSAWLRRCRLRVRVAIAALLPSTRLVDEAKEHGVCDEATSTGQEWEHCSNAQRDKNPARSVTSAQQESFERAHSRGKTRAEHVDHQTQRLIAPDPCRAERRHPRWTSCGHRGASVDLADFTSRASRALQPLACLSHLIIVTQRDIHAGQNLFGRQVDDLSSLVTRHPFSRCPMGVAEGLRPPRTTTPSSPPTRTCASALRRGR